MRPPARTHIDTIIVAAAETGAELPIANGIVDALRSANPVADAVHHRTGGHRRSVAGSQAPREREHRG